MIRQPTAGYRYLFPNDFQGGIILGKLTSADRKKVVLLVLWLISGIGMIVVGILALIHRKETINTISGFLGVCALITGVITLIIRILQAKRLGKSSFSLDIVIWLALGFLLLNTGLFNKLGKLVFIIGGIILMVPGVAFTNAIRDMADSDYISGSVRMLDAVISFFCIAIGVGVVLALYGNIAGAPLLL